VEDLVRVTAPVIDATDAAFRADPHASPPPAVVEELRRCGPPITEVLRVATEDLEGRP
jgi:hypothetical protein